MDKIQEIFGQMDPKKALEEITSIIKNLLSHLDEKARLDFVVKLIGNADSDKTGSMVNL